MGSKVGDLRLKLKFGALSLGAVFGLVLCGHAFAETTSMDHRITVTDSVIQKLDGLSVQLAAGEEKTVVESLTALIKDITHINYPGQTEAFKSHAVFKGLSETNSKVQSCFIARNLAEQAVKEEKKEVIAFLKKQMVGNAIQYRNCPPLSNLNISSKALGKSYKAIAEPGSKLKELLNKKELTDEDKKTRSTLKANQIAAAKELGKAIHGVLNEAYRADSEVDGLNVSSSFVKEKLIQWKTAELHSVNNVVSMVSGWVLNDTFEGELAVVLYEKLLNSLYYMMKGDKPGLSKGSLAHLNAFVALLSQTNKLFMIHPVSATTALKNTGEIISSELFGLAIKASSHSEKAFQSIGNQLVFKMVEMLVGLQAQVANNSFPGSKSLVSNSEKLKAFLGLDYSWVSFTSMDPAEYQTKGSSTVINATVTKAGRTSAQSALKSALIWNYVPVAGTIEAARGYLVGSVASPKYVWTPGFQASQKSKLIEKSVRLMSTFQNKDKMHGLLKSIFPEITLSDITSALSDFGSDKQKSTKEYYGVGNNNVVATAYMNGQSAILDPGLGFSKLVVLYFGESEYKALVEPSAGFLAAPSKSIKGTDLQDLQSAADLKAYLVGSLTKAINFLAKESPASLPSFASTYASGMSHLHGEMSRSSRLSDDVKRLQKRAGLENAKVVDTHNWLAKTYTSLIESAFAAPQKGLVESTFTKIKEAISKLAAEANKSEEKEAATQKALASYVDGVVLGTSGAYHKLIRAAQQSSVSATVAQELSKSLKVVNTLVNSYLSSDALISNGKKETGTTVAVSDTSDEDDEDMPESDEEESSSDQLVVNTSYADKRSSVPETFLGVTANQIKDSLASGAVEVEVVDTKVETEQKDKDNKPIMRTQRKVSYVSKSPRDLAEMLNQAYSNNRF